MDQAEHQLRVDLDSQLIHLMDLLGIIVARLLTISSEHRFLSFVIIPHHFDLLRS